MSLRFKTFLQERETAPVYVNGNGKLTLIGNLIEKKFGLHFRDLGGSCLASQAVFSIAAVTGVPPQEIVDAAKNKLKGGYSGLTFETLFKALNHRPLKLKDGRVLSLDLSLHRYDLPEAIKAVKDGQPVVGIVSSGIDTDAGEDGSVHWPDTSGILKRLPSLSSQTLGMYHALLMVGHDSGEKTAIFRDNRSTYAKEGYIKIRDKLINDKNMRLIGIHVDDFKLTPAKKEKK